MTRDHRLTGSLGSDHDRTTGDAHCTDDATTPDRFSRRSLLRATAGVAVTGGLAGCSGLSGGSPGDGTDTTGSGTGGTTADTPTATPTSSTKTVTGRVRTPSGDPITDATVGVYSPDRFDETWYGALTDSDGSFSVEVPRQRFFVGVTQVTDENPSTSHFDLSADGMKYPRDELADIYGITELGANATDVGAVSVPDANLLTIEVVDANGDPVSSAGVDVLHVPPAFQELTGDEEGFGVVNIKTDSEGRFNFSRDGPGIEVTGTIDVRVRPPGAGYQSTADEQRRRVDVTDDSSVEFELENER